METWQSPTPLHNTWCLIDNSRHCLCNHTFIAVVLKWTSRSDTVGQGQKTFPTDTQGTGFLNVSSKPGAVAPSFLLGKWELFQTASTESQDHSFIRLTCTRLLIASQLLMRSWGSSPSMLLDGLVFAFILFPILHLFVWDFYTHST